MSEPTAVRYGTSALLVAMTVIAITIAALDRIQRYFPDDVRPQLVIHWAIYFVMVGAAMAWLARKRYVSEKRAAPIAFVLPVFSYYSPGVPWIGRVLAGAFLVICGSILWFALSFVVAFDDQSPFMVLVNVYAYLALYLSSLGISYLWWWRSVRFCEHGIVAPTKLIPWSDCRKWYWDASYRDVLVIEFQRNVRMEVQVPDEERATLEAFIAARMRDSGERAEV